MAQDWWIFINFHGHHKFAVKIHYNSSEFMFKRWSLRFFSTHELLVHFVHEPQIVNFEKLSLKSEMFMNIHHLVNYISPRKVLIWHDTSVYRKHKANQPYKIVWQHRCHSLCGKVYILIYMLINLQKTKPGPFLKQYGNDSLSICCCFLFFIVYIM